MRFRIARHTTSLDVIRAFYTHVIGLEELGGFENHEGYSGLFLGKIGADWHLEFTISSELPIHRGDEDDALVFYVGSQNELQAIHDRAIQNSCKIVKAKNPYWNRNGLTMVDPDGFMVVISVRS